MGKTRLEVWSSDLAVAARIRKVKGWDSVCLFHEALMALCEKDPRLRDFGELLKSGGGEVHGSEEEAAVKPAAQGAA